MLDTNRFKQRHVHECMSGGVVPAAVMHGKAEKMRRGLHSIATVLNTAGLPHALQCYATQQTVEPDGEIQLEKRCLSSSAYDAATWNLKVQANLPSASTHT